MSAPSKPNDRTPADRRAWTVVVSATALLLLAITGLRGIVRRPAPVTTGTPAPPFVATELLPRSGRRSLEDYRGRVILLNIWATWCAPCREEMPSLRALQESVDTTRLKVVVVSVDRAPDELVLEYARRADMPFVVLHDRTGDIQMRYQFAGLPGSVIIDQRGVIRERFVGPRDWNAEPTKRVVTSVLDRAAPAF